MASYGKNLRIKIGDGGSPESFTPIGGARQDQFTLNNGAIDITNKDTNDWRQILQDAGTRQATISITGIFSDTASEAALRLAAINRAIVNYQVVLPNGDIWEGPFYVSTISDTAAYNDAMQYSATLESAGELTYTVA